jgi:hypothetical protein
MSSAWKSLNVLRNFDNDLGIFVQPTRTQTDLHKFHINLVERHVSTHGVSIYVRYSVKCVYYLACAPLTYCFKIKVFELFSLR